MKMIKDFITAILTLIQARISLRIFHYSDQSPIRSWKIVSNVAELRAIENNRVESVEFSPEEYNYFGLKITGADSSRQLINELRIPADYQWRFNDGENDSILVSCPGLLQVLTIPLVSSQSKVEFHPKGKFGVLTIVRASEVPLGEELLSLHSLRPPFVVQFSRLYKFIDDYYYSAGMFHSIDEMIQLETDTSTLPMLGEDVFALLPRIASKFVGLYNNPKSKSLATITLLVGISGTIPNVTSSHFNKKMWPNLLMILVAAAGAGKGLVDDVHAVLFSIERWWRERYKSNLAVYQAELRKFKAGEITDEPTKPALRSLFIPLDASSAAFFKRLVDNEGEALAIDTEIDAFVQANSKDWGGFSVFLRKAFHFEVIEVDRAFFDSPLLVEKPKIAMIMAGTFGQFQRLFKSAEDGLYSRCIVVTIPRARIELLNPYLNSGDLGFEKELDALSVEILEMYQVLLLKEEIRFRWSDSQAEQLMNFFNKTAGPFAEVHREEAEAIIFRHMNMATRLGMIISTLRAWELNQLSVNELLATEDDFNIVMATLDLSLQHNMAVLNMLKQDKPIIRDVRNMSKRSFLANLPINTTISRRECVAIGKSNGMPERSVDEYLKKLVQEKCLQQIKVGVYKRIS